MHTLEGTYRSDAGRDIAYKVDFAVQGSNVVWEGRARLQADVWADVGAGSFENIDPGLVEEAVTAMVHAAIEERLRRAAG